MPANITEEYSRNRVVLYGGIQWEEKGFQKIANRTFSNQVTPVEKSARPLEDRVKELQK